MQSMSSTFSHLARSTLASSVLVLLAACGGTPGDVTSSSSSGSANSSSSSSTSASSSNSSSTSSSSSNSSSNSSSSSSNSSSSGSNANLFIDDDFESWAAGETPTDWRTILSHGNVDHSFSPPPGSSAEIDTSKSHSGSNSIKISTSDASAPHFIFQALPSGLNSIYVRTWVYSNVQLGGGSPSGPQDHAHFIGTFETPGFDHAALRFGPVRGAYLGGFIKNDDAFSLNTSTTFISPNKWTCVEWAIVKNSTHDEMHGWVNGTQVLEATQQSDWQNIKTNNFATADATKFISFGWRKFGSGPNVSSIWFDDIAVGTSRIGCN